MSEYEVGAPEFNYRSDYAVYPKGKDQSICYCTDRERAEMIATALTERDLLRRQVAEKDRQVDALVHLYGAILTCYQCGLMGGPKVDGNCGPERLCVPDVCEEHLERWSLKQAKNGGGGE